MTTKLPSVELTDRERALLALMMKRIDGQWTPRANIDVGGPDLPSWIRTALAGEAKAGDPCMSPVKASDHDGIVANFKSRLAALEAENARLRAENAKLNDQVIKVGERYYGPCDIKELLDSIASTVEERDTAVTQRDEFQRRMLEAEKQLRSYQESYEIVAKERDALAAKVKEMEAARDRAESEVNALLQTDHALGKAVAIYSAIRAAAKE